MATLIDEVGKVGFGRVEGRVGFEVGERVVLELSWIIRLFEEVAGYTYRKLGH